MSVYVNYVSEYDITYIYPGETVTYTTSRNVVKKIRYGSGRVEKITDLIIINDENDWEKVITTHVPSDIKGLTLKGEVTTRAAVFGGNLKKLDKVAIEKIKRQAATMGAHIILIETKILDATNRILVTGKAYTY